MLLVERFQLLFFHRWFSELGIDRFRGDTTAAAVFGETVLCAIIRKRIVLYRNVIVLYGRCLLWVHTVHKCSQIVLKS